MSEQVVYLITKRGDKIQWRVTGHAYQCRDGSTNFKLDMFPELVFNIRNPKSEGEKKDAERGRYEQERP